MKVLAKIVAAGALLLLPAATLSAGGHGHHGWKRHYKHSRGYDRGGHSHGYKAYRPAPVYRYRYAPPVYYAPRPVVVYAPAPVYGVYGAPVYRRAPKVRVNVYIGR